MTDLASIGAGAPKVTLEDLAWLSGSWQGVREGNPVEEHWSRPAGGSLMGMFRWLRDGQVYMYEFLLIEAEDDNLVFRLKHFNPGMAGWEEKDEALVFDLMSGGPDKAVFKHRSRPMWMIYRREGEDGLTAILETVKDGLQIPLEFRYRRV
jgi:hypothetical protein